MPYFEFEDYPTSYISIGSNGGRDQHAAWYHNISRTPDIEIQLAGTKLAARARIARGEERELLWKRIIAVQPRYADYQRTTTRKIPNLSANVFPI